MTGRRLALVLCAAFALAGTAPAYADKSVVRDGTGDVWSPDGPHSWSREGSVVNTDVTRAEVDHRSDTLVVNVRYVRLRKRVSDEINLDLALRTSAKTIFSIFVQEDWLFRETFVPILDIKTQERIDCPGAAGSANPGNSIITFSIPRSCLGDPDWVRYQLQAESYTESDGLFLDDARSARPEPKTWSRRLLPG